MRGSLPHISRSTMAHLRVLILLATLFVSIAVALQPSNVEASADGSATSQSVDVELGSMSELPTTTNLTPNTGPTTGGTPVTLTGTNFEPADTQILVAFRRGGVTVPAADVTINTTGTTATFTMPPAPDDGLAGVMAITPAGRSNDQLFTYVAPPPPPLPTTTNLTPNTGPTTGGTPVTLTGTNFAPADTQILVAFRRGGVTVPAADVTINTTGTTATFTMPAAPDDGLAGVMAITPAGRSNDQLFTYVAPPPPPLPTTTNLTPNTGPTAGGTPVTLTGTNFEPANTRIVVALPRGGGVTVPATDVTINTTGTTATFTMPPALQDGPAGVIAITPAGNSNGQLFTYIPPPPPTTTNLTPNSGPTAGGTPVTLTGTNFEPANTRIVVALPRGGGVTVPAADVTINTTGTTATFTMPPALQDGPAGVIAVTPAGSSNGQLFTYIPPPPPTTTNLTPNSGPTAGGTPVTLTGTNFEPANTRIVVALPRGGGVTVPATDVTINTTGTTATFTMPPALQDGPAGVIAITPAGSSNGQLFTYIPPPPPTTTNLTPNSGPTAGGTPVTLTGTNFEPANTRIVVALPRGGGVTVPAADVTINTTGTTATFTMPPALQDGPAGVIAITPAGRSNGQLFTYIPPPPPTTTNLTPNSGPSAGGTTVTLTGTNFEPANTQIVVAFPRGGGITIPATDVTINTTGTTATFTMPPAREDGLAGVFAITPAGRSNDQLFTYQPSTAPRVAVDGSNAQRLRPAAHDHHPRLEGRRHRGR